MCIPPAHRKDLVHDTLPWGVNINRFLATPPLHPLMHTRHPKHPAAPSPGRGPGCPLSPPQAPCSKAPQGLPLTWAGL